MTQKLTASSIMSLLETTKSERQAFISELVEKLKEGYINPIQLHLQAKCTMELMNELMSNDDYKSLLLEEAQKNGKRFEMYNAKFEVREVGTKYDFSKTEDTIWQELSESLSGIKDKLKEREDMLKKLPESGMVDPSTGAMIYPATKTSSTSVIVTLK